MDLKIPKVEKTVDDGGLPPGGCSGAVRGLLGRATRRLRVPQQGPRAGADQEEHQNDCGRGGVSACGYAVIITAQRLNNPVSQVGEDFGSHCAAWEDGACSNTSCAAGPGHTCGTKRECKALWPDYNFDNDQVRAREPGAAGALRSRVCRGRECAAGGGRAMLDAG
jgi:hypothetical protein